MQLTEAQRIVYDTAKRFAENEIRPHVRERRNDPQFPIDVMRKLADTGLLGGTFPEEYGGGGIDNVSYVLICEAIGAVSPSVFTAALTVQLSLVSTAVNQFGTEEQKRRFLPELFAAKRVGAFALSEPNVGSDPAAGELTARKNGDHWTLNGSKFWISNGSIADWIIVFAQTDPGKRHKGMATFLVDGDSAGVERQPIPDKLGLHASDTAALFFDNVEVADDRLIGEVGQGFKIAQTSLESGRTSTAACAVGIIQACLDACVAYAQQREQWGGDRLRGGEAADDRGGARPGCRDPGDEERGHGEAFRDGSGRTGGPQRHFSARRRRLSGRVPCRRSPARRDRPQPLRGHDPDPEADLGARAAGGVGVLAQGL
jgi:alkylation response protein AidB-like acyl-CoA dehydrogenase